MTQLSNMLPASALNSVNSSEVSVNTVIPPYSSQFPTDSRKSNSDPLDDLIRTEQVYIETLKMIDCQIAPIWMKQMTSASPDFSELLIHAHEILRINKRFYMKLLRITADRHQLGEALIQWVNDMEPSYTSYCRTFIPNLNQRYDILQNPAIHNLLKTLSASISFEINLESLFDAPMRRLKYYKGLYNRLLESSDSGKPDYSILVTANEQLDTIMILAKNNSNTPSFRPVVSFTPPPLPRIQTTLKPAYMSRDLIEFERQVDCSETMDLHSGALISYQLHVANPEVHLIMRDSFVMIPDDDQPSVPVHFLLTSEVLVMCREISLSQFLLLYPAVPIDDITVKSESIDREIVGEYILGFTIFGKKYIRVHADSKKTRNTWVGVDQDAPSTITLVPQSMGRVVQRRRVSHISASSYRSSIISDRSRSRSVRTTDFFTFYSDSGDVSPMESSDDEEEEEEVNEVESEKKSSQTRDKVVDIHDNQKEEEAPRQPPKNQPVKIIPHVPIFARALLQNDLGKSTPTPPKKDKINVKDQRPPILAPVKESSHARISHIETPATQTSKMSISTALLRKISTSSFSSSLMNFNKANSSPVDSKPSSPRNIEVQRAFIPEAMQAVTQNTDDYLSSNNRVPRGTSSRSPQMMQQQYPPQMMQQQQQQKPSYHTPHQQYRHEPQSTGYNNRPMQPSTMPPRNNYPPQQQYYPQANVRSMNGTVSPPHSPGNDILFSNNECGVFHWTNQSWYAAEGRCLLQIRLSHDDRTCVSVQLENTGQPYLTAWILPNTVVRQPSPTDVNISLFMGERKENYLIHFYQPQDAHVFAGILHKALQESQRELLPEQEIPDPVDHVNVPQTLTSIMQCKAKLFVQNETNSWSTFGSVKMSISQQSPSKRMLIQIENDKNKLVSATVKSGNVERITSKRITFLLADEAAKTSIVYMIHLRDEEAGNKIYEYLRTRNAENGW